MNRERFIILYRKYQSGSLSESEHFEWHSALADEQLVKKLEQFVDWFDIPEQELMGLSDVKSEMMLKYIIQHPQVNSGADKLWMRITIAAAISIILFGVGLFFYDQKVKQEHTVQVSIKNDVDPGKSGATLTLANGKKIRIDDVTSGELAEENGVVITKSANGDLIYEIKNKAGVSNGLNILSTANGETYRMRLPDGSFVWLNSGSSLTYPVNLVKNAHRSVKLEGEAYFEIAKDKLHPFVVESRGQKVEVLGTHFNVNAYADESTVFTTLLEGSIKLTAGNYKEILKPGQQVMSNGITKKLVEVNTENITAWKEGVFALNGKDFKSAMKEIARWYDVEVIYDSSVPNELQTGGRIFRNSKLSVVLKLIESSGQVHFKIDGRKIYVSK